MKGEDGPGRTTQQGRFEAATAPRGGTRGASKGRRSSALSSTSASAVVAWAEQAVAEVVAKAEVEAQAVVRSATAPSDARHAGTAAALQELCRIERPGHAPGTVDAVLASLASTTGHQSCGVPPGKVDAIYINLASRSDRRNRIAQLLRAARLPARRLEAKRGDEAPEWVVGRTWDSSLNAKFDTKTLPHPRLRMTAGERGCAMSHALIWSLSASRADADVPILVLEDDVEFAADLAAHVERLVHVAEATFAPAERRLLLYLGADVAQWHDRRCCAVAPGQTLREANYVWQTSSYIIWPPAARALLAEMPIDCPVDNFISRAVLERRVRAFVVLPNLVSQSSPYCRGDIVHSNVFKSHVHVGSELRAQLEANARLLAEEDAARARRQQHDAAARAAAAAAAAATKAVVAAAAAADAASGAVSSQPARRRVPQVLAQPVNAPGPVAAASLGARSNGASPVLATRAPCRRA